MTLGIIAPASAARDAEELVDRAIAGVDALGLNPKPAATADRLGYLAQRDVNRLVDLHQMFADPEVDGIICLRGGYGTGRLVDAIDYNPGGKNPKIFIGFSDITMLSLAFLPEVQTCYL